MIQPIEPGRLILRRTSERDIKFRNLYVQIDDQEERNLPYGKTLEVQLAPGNHAIRVSNKVYTKSETFSVGSGGTAHFEAANIWGKGPVGTFLMLLGGVSYRVDLWPSAVPTEEPIPRP